MIDAMSAPRRVAHAGYRLEPRTQVNLRCTRQERAQVRAWAAREGLSISDFMRRCIDQYVLEDGDDVPLLAEYRHARAS